MATTAYAGTIELNQARNGGVQQPVSPVQWVKGNAGPSTAHYLESQSIPYRLVLGGLEPGPHRVILEWDTLQNGKHAIDYITHFDRLQPHDLFTGHHEPETIDPLAGLADSFGEPTTFAIPTPTSENSPVAGQPATSFLTLPEAERRITIWNGTITNLAYIRQDGFSSSSASTRLQIDFLSTQPTVVLAWGGHIATQFDWGVGQSASGINGSPYHTRMVSVDGGGGNQDLSLQITPILPPPPCGIAGPATVCAQATIAFTVPNPSLAPGVLYTWSIADTDSGASILGASTGTSIEVRALRGGAYTLNLTVSVGTSQSQCSQIVEVLEATGASDLADQTACPTTAVTFATTPTGTGPFEFAWRKDGELLPGANAAALELSAVTMADAGVYCVTVTGACGAVERCAVLTVYSPLTVVSGPPEAIVECIEEVPPPDPSLVQAEGGLPPYQVEHVSDEGSGCFFTLKRTYRVTDACGQVALHVNSIVVVDSTPPVLSCAPDKTVEAGEAWEFDPPTATDNCAGEVVITVPGEVENTLGSNGLPRVTKTWLATDACGNSSTCSQTVTVIDTTPPVLTCPEDLSFPCPGPSGVEVIYAAIVTDIGDPEVDVVFTPPSGTVFPFGVHTVDCIATDASGNASVCSFTVTIFDDQPPVIVCPPDMTVAEASPGSGSAVVTFETPAAEDVCDEALTVVCSPPSGSEFAAGRTRVTCVATDAAGNTAECAFTVHVVPVTLRVNSLADSGPGTLREAMLDANASPGDNIIVFNLPGAAPHIIRLQSPLPEVTDRLVLDGVSQPGFVLEPVVGLEGGDIPSPQAPLKAGLEVRSDRAVIRGLILSGFDVGLVLGGGGGHVVENNLIGVIPGGGEGEPGGNLQAGILVRSAHNRIGSPGHGNVLSGNHGPGLVIETAEAANNLIQGNVIAFNGGAGVSVAPSAGPGQAILGNAIHDNAGLGIDLGADGVTPNPEVPQSAGPMGWPAFPEAVIAQLGIGSLRVEGDLAGRPGEVRRVECFLNAEPDPTGYGEGRHYLGGAEVSLNASGQARFSLDFAVDAGTDQWVTATATDSENNTSEFSAAVPVTGAPIILVQPVGGEVGLGGGFTLCVTAAGTPPLTYQWRRNGANIPQANGSCFSIASADLESGGSYSVVVANALGAVTSEPAILLLQLPKLAPGDHFADRVRLVGMSGLAAGTNTAATREPGEPEHFGKPGGRSVWYTWTAPDTGIATFRTTGSTFDTLLAVYSGTALTNLVVEGEDEDSGGYYTSGARFNALAGTAYHIAIDGFGGATGDFVFGWQFEPSDRLLPVILARPQNVTVAEGGTARFAVEAANTCRDGHHNCRHPGKDHHDHHKGEDVPLFYQWLFNGTPIAGATNSALHIPNVQSDHVGAYTVRVSDGFLSVVTLPAWLQLNMTGDSFQAVQAEDKFLDAARSPNPLLLGGFTVAVPGGGQAEPGTASLSGGTVARGYTGTQVFTTSRSSTEPSDVLVCGVPGGATEWLTVVPIETGMLHLNTQGSSFDTLLAAFAYSTTNANSLVLLDCNNNASPTVTYSAITVPVVAGRTNFIIVDGVNGRFGTLRLNYSLIVPATFTFVANTVQGVQMRVAGRTNLNLRIEGTLDFSLWTPLITTNARTGVFDFIDRQSPALPRRYYRAVLLP